MSKIYEALLRAELERAVTRGDRSSEAEAGPDLDTLMNPGALMDAEPMITDMEPSSFPEGDFHDSVADDSMEFSGIPRRPWEPIPGYLPALEERGPQVEQFRKLRSHLMELRDAGPLKSVVISSGLPGEGKSFVTLNLALAFSRHKSTRVLLIDGDMRRSSQHKALGTSRAPGLTDFLAGERPLRDVLQACDTAGRTVHPGLAALTFIAGGRDTENAGDLAANPRFAQLITAAAESFDWIFVDSSPANLVSDAVSLTRACDGVLLVAREGITKFKTAQQAQAQFKSARALGFVLNAVHKLPVKGDYYGNYSSYDSYKSEA